MSESAVEVVKIADEAALWHALERALAHTGDSVPFLVDFSESAWAKIRLTFNGRLFHASLTPSAMKGIVELQASLYRSAAAILRDDASIRRLTNAQRAALELTFTVGEGSAETEGDGKGFLVTLAGAISTMTSAHKLIALLVLGTMYFGTTGIKSYMEAEGAHEEKVELLEHEERTQRLLVDSARRSPDAATVATQSAAGFDAVVRNSGDVSSLTVQGTNLPREQIDKIRSSTRRESQNIEMKRQFQILLVDPTSPDGFTVKVKDIATGKVFNAVIYDSLASDATRATIRSAEWKKQKVFLHITARQLGEDIIDAKVVGAKPVKPQKLSIPLQIRRA